MKDYSQSYPHFHRPKTRYAWLPDAIRVAAVLALVAWSMAA